MRISLATRGATPSAFERRCIPPPPQRGCRVGDPGPGGVAPPSNTPGIATPPCTTRTVGTPVFGRHAASPGAPTARNVRRGVGEGRIAALGATMDLHHGLLMRIAIVGAHGQLGAAVVHECA